MTRKTLIYGLALGLVAGLIEAAGHVFFRLPRTYFHIAATALVAAGVTTLLYVNDRNHEAKTKLR